MQALQPTEVLSTLEASGLVLSLTPDRGLKVTPASGLTDTLRAIIRECKPMLVDHLRRIAANDVAKEVTPQDEMTIEETDLGTWPHTMAMNTKEVDTFISRVEHFAIKGVSYEAAERLADKLVIRDREGDDRRLCLECAHLQGAGRWRCVNWKQAEVAQVGLSRDLVVMLQRCPGYGGVNVSTTQ